MPFFLHNNQYCLLLSLYFSSELNVASVDSKLSVTVARNVSKTIKLFCVKSEQLVSLVFLGILFYTYVFSHVYFINFLVYVLIYLLITNQPYPFSLSVKHSQMFGYPIRSYLIILLTYWVIFSAVNLLTLPTLLTGIEIFCMLKNSNLKI